MLKVLTQLAGLHSKGSSLGKQVAIFLDKENVQTHLSFQELDSKSVKDQVHDVVVNLSFLCAFRAVRPWISLWYNRTVRKRLKKDACEVMQLTGSAHEHVTAQVHSFL